MAQKSETLPRHVGIIMDGNGRWAKKRGLPRKFGHRAGGKTVEKTVAYAFEKGIETVTLYAFSSENWNRPKEEVEGIFSLIADFLKNHVKRLTDNGIRFVALGDKSVLPDALKSAIESDEKLTEKNTKGTLAIAVNYGGRQDIVSAVNKAIKSGVNSVTEDSFEALLSTHELHAPDLIIRTGGQKRLSNFLLYESAYAELYFTECLWPDFTKKELDAALADFASRKRNFGGLSDNA